MYTTVSELGAGTLLPVRAYLFVSAPQRVVRGFREVNYPGAFGISIIGPDRKPEAHYVGAVYARDSNAIIAIAMRALLERHPEYEVELCMRRIGNFEDMIRLPGGHARNTSRSRPVNASEHYSAIIPAYDGGRFRIAGGHAADDAHWLDEAHRLAKEKGVPIAHDYANEDPIERGSKRINRLLEMTAVRANER